MYTCHSGGAKGSDYIWEIESIRKGFKVIAYSFDGHNTNSRNRVILNSDELEEGYQHIIIANKRLNRNIYNISKYVKNLISRDWFQVKNSDSILAIGTFDKNNNVNGGTGYAVSCAIDNEKPIYLFEQNINKWFYFDYGTKNFKIYNNIPKLTENFTGIGTRDINQNGINAIVDVFKIN